MSNEASQPGGNETKPTDEGAGHDAPASEVVHELYDRHLWQIQPVRDLLLVAAILGLVWFGYALRAVTVPLLVGLLLAYLIEPLVQRLMRYDSENMTRVRAVTLILITCGGAVLIVLALVVPLIVAQVAGFVGDVRGGQLRNQIETFVERTPAFVQEELQDLVGILPAGSSNGRDRAVNGPGTMSVEDGDEGVAPGKADDSDASGDASSDGEQSATSKDGEDPGVPGASGDNGVDIAGDGGSGGGSDAGEKTAEGDSTLGATDAIADQPDERPLTHEEIRTIIAQSLDERAVGDGGPARSTSTSASLLGVAGSGLAAIWGVMSVILYFVLLLFLIPFYLFFFSVWYPQILIFGDRLIPQKNRAHTHELIAKMDAVVSGFVRGRIIISIIAGVLLALGWFVMDVPYGIVIGIITGLLFLVPYLAGVGALFASVFLFFDMGSAAGRSDMWWVWALLLPLGWYGVVQFIETYFLTPKIAGDATNLDPVTIVVAVLAGGAVLGVYGMLLAIPLAACGKILLIEVLFPRIDEWLRGERSDPIPIERK